MLVYLGICAVLAFGAALGLTFAGVAPAAAAHAAFAAGAMPLVFGAVAHFVPVLSRSGAAPALMRRLPLAVQAAGIAAVPGLAGWLPPAALHAAAGTATLAALAFWLWILRRGRAALGAPHPGLRWYAAAMLALAGALLLVPFWLAHPELRAPLRLIHLHLNTLGFIGLAALGTLPVLLPTALGRPDPGAAGRLRRDLVLAAGGAALAAGAAPYAWPLAALGALGPSYVALNNLSAWRAAFGLRALFADGAAASLAAATLGWLLSLALGLTHGAGLVGARPAIAAWAALFLLPLVTGALTQLLPVWRHPGPDSPARREMRRRLAAGGRWRAAGFLVGGVLLAIGVPLGLTFAAAALAAFVLALAGALGARPPAA